MRILAMAAVVAVAASAAAQSTGAGKVYVGDEGVQAEIVPLKSDAQAFLIRVSGTGSELDGKVRRHTLAESGARLDYQGKLHGRQYNTVIARDGRYTMFAPGKRDMTLKYDEAKSKALNGETVFAAYQQQTKDGTLEALERFDRKARQGAAEKELAEMAAATDKVCGGKVGVAVEWSGISDELLGDLSIPSYCGAPLAAMQRLCETGAGKAQLATVKKLQCRFGPELKLALDGATLAWTTSKDGSNLEEFAQKELAGAPASEDGPPWGNASTLAQKQALEKTTLCTDGKAHYVALAPHEHEGAGMYYGDGKKFVAVPPLKFLSGSDFLDPRHVNPTANPNFRGYDFRLISSVEAEKGACSARCGERKIPLTVVDADKKRALLLGASYGPTPQQHRPHVLLRDEHGVYYYVDKGFKPSEEKKFRLFKGPKGSLKELKMTNVVSDSEGEIFSTKTGSLRLIIDAKQSVWIQGGKSTTLRPVPVDENLPLIYNELGVYLGERLGTPCDDL